jgi:hypothetical protein
VRRRLIVVLLVSGAALVLLPGVGAAALTSCATPPAAYTGTDATVAALTQANIDADQNCKAGTDRQDALQTTLDALKTQAHTDSGAIAGTLSGWTSSSPLQVALPAGGTGQAVQVTNWPTSQPVSYDTATAGTIDGQAQALHSDLWVLVGVVVGTFLMSEFLRKVWP